MRSTKTAHSLSRIVPNLTELSNEKNFDFIKRLNSARLYFTIAVIAGASLSGCGGCIENSGNNVSANNPASKIEDSYVSHKNPETHIVPNFKQYLCLRDKDKDTYFNKSGNMQLNESSQCPAGYTKITNSSGVGILFDCDGWDDDNTVYPNAKELCDGKDNDCDGETDEEVYLTVNTLCGTKKLLCLGTDNDSKPKFEDAFPPQELYCDGKDEDCNGYTDDGLSRKCFTECGSGLEYCVEGKWKNCDAKKPTAELCDFIDNDCNGKIDEKSIFDCYSSCGTGKQFCVNGLLTTCNATLPTKEICDGIDNDCDGQIDENLKNACNYCGPAPVEICDGKDNNCNGQIDEGVKNACGYCGPVPIEICDGIDNDCDGQIDENLKNACNYCGPAPVEICDGKDNNCNGQIDEGIKNGCCTEKWYCKNQVIGTACVNKDGSINNFVQKPIIASDWNDLCQAQWCCNDQQWGEVGCEYGQNYLKNTCNCITYMEGFNEREEIFFSQSEACPAHQFCNDETKINILFENQQLSPVEVWMNWQSYGKNPLEKKILQFGESYLASFDASALPSGGTEIQLCTSYGGCSQDIPLDCGSKKEFYVAQTIVGTQGVEQSGVALEFSNYPYKTCDRKTSVLATFSNHKTMDLKVGFNWEGRGFPPMEKVLLPPGGSYTLVVDKSMLPLEGTNIRLWTSSYGSSEPMHIGCGSNLEFKVDWFFGTSE